MQSQFSESHQIAEPLLKVMTREMDNDCLVLADSTSVNNPVRFQSQFIDYMEMYADAGTVARYLDEHKEWFRRCAHPMKAEPIGLYGYALTIGRYGSFGYEVEPKIGLNLLPQDKGVYRIETIPIPGYVEASYDVDFKATMELVEVSSDGVEQGADIPANITRVEWCLDLVVTIQFPRFIYALPLPVIQTTGDKLLRQVIRQVSRRLTHKVQLDFHTTHGLPMPKAQRHKWFGA